MSMATKTRIATPGPWAREYACGCREALDDGEATGRDDTCPRHGEHAVVVGFLTPELAAEEMLEALQACEENLRLIHGGAGPVARDAPMPAHSTFQAWRMASEAIAKATGRDS